MFSHRIRQATALTLAASMAFFVASGPLMATENASFRGRVLQADGITPRPGVIVSLVDREERQVFASAPTNDEGVFKIDSAPPGSYTLIAEGPEGGFVAPAPVAVQAGSNRPLALSMHVAAADDDAAAAGAPASPDPELDLWLKIVIIGTLTLGGFTAFDSVTGQADGSGFLPPTSQ